MAGVKTAARLMGRNIRSSIAYAKQEITTGPSGTTYGSLLTYRLGDAAAKWHLEPEQDHTIAPPRDERYAAHQAKELEAWFADGGRDMSFRFSIQVAARAGAPPRIRDTDDELAVRLIRRLRAVRHRADHDSIVLCGSEGP